MIESCKHGLVGRCGLCDLEDAEHDAAMAHMKPTAYRWVGPGGRFELDTEPYCSDSARAAGWASEPLYNQDALDAAVAAERERCAASCDAAAEEYDANAASTFATEPGRELHRCAAEWARSMAAAIRAG